MMAMTSCTNEEVTQVAESRAIGFDAFVTNSTRAEITADNITEFSVFGGFDSQLDNVFNNVKVIKSSGSWTYSPLQYWTMGKSYTFQGYAPTADGISATPTANGVNFSGFTADGQTDLLASEVKTFDNVQTAQQVQLAFKHILSKVQFKFTSGFAPNVTLTISNLKVNGLSTKGNYTAAASDAGTWDALSGTSAYDVTTNEGGFTSAAAETTGSVFVLPQSITEKAINVTFTVTASGALDMAKDFTVNIPVGTLQKGYSYTYTATIDASNIDPDPDDPDNPELKPIEFDDPTVTDWTSAADTEIIPGQEQGE